MSMEEHDVIKYLAKHPTFFQNHVELLETLSIPHPLGSGNAISLIEKQVQLLRTSTDDYKKEFQSLVKAARGNEMIVQRSKKIVVAGMHCANLDDFSILLDDVIRNDFAISNHTILLFSDNPIDTNIQTRPVAQSLSIFGNRLSKEDKRYDVIPYKEMRMLFPDGVPKALSSFATYPLSYRHQGAEYYLGMLVLAHEKEGYFQQGKQQLALDYFAQLFSSILIRLML